MPADNTYESVFKDYHAKKFAVFLDVDMISHLMTLCKDSDTQIDPKIVQKLWQAEVQY